LPTKGNNIAKFVNIIIV